MLAFAVDDSTLGQIVGREFNTDFVSRDNPDEVFSHSAGHVRHHFGPRFQLNAEPRVRERLGHGALDLEGLFFFSQNLTSIKGLSRASSSGSTTVITMKLGKETTAFGERKTDRMKATKTRNADPKVPRDSAAAQLSRGRDYRGR